MELSVTDRDHEIAAGEAHQAIDRMITSPESGEYEGFLSPPDSDLFLPIPYHLRFTFSDQDKDLKCLESKSFINRCKQIHGSLLNKLQPYFYNNQYTSGFEVRNKLGSCKAHIHACFKSTSLKNTIDKAIKRHLSDTWDQEVVGNHAKMFKEWTQLRDEHKFWRYPIKQVLDPTKCNGFSQEYLEQQHQIGKDTYAIGQEVAQSKLDKRDNSDTLFLRVYSKLKKLKISTIRGIADQFIQFYLDEDRPLNKTTIQGYTTLASVKLGLVSKDELLNDWGY